MLIQGFSVCLEYYVYHKLSPSLNSQFQICMLVQIKGSIPCILKRLQPLRQFKLIAVNLGHFESFLASLREQVPTFPVPTVFI